MRFIIDILDERIGLILKSPIFVKITKLFFNRKRVDFNKQD